MTSLGATPLAILTPLTLAARAEGRTTPSSDELSLWDFSFGKSLQQLPFLLRPGVGMRLAQGRKVVVKKQTQRCSFMACE